MSNPSDTSETRCHAGAAAPWLILLGVAGISLALFGVPAPVLSCVLLIGLGADADLARRASMFEAVGYGWVVGPVRSVHAVMYVGLYTIGWSAMAAVAAGAAARTLLAIDLAISVVLLVGAARLSEPRSGR